MMDILSVKFKIQQTGICNQAYNKNIPDGSVLQDRLYKYIQNQTFRNIIDHYSGFRGWIQSGSGFKGSGFFDFGFWIADFGINKQFSPPAALETQSSALSSYRREIAER